MVKSPLQPQNLLTYILMALSLVLALFALTMPKEIDYVNEKIIESSQEDDFSQRLQESLLPPGYTKPSPTPSIALTPSTTQIPSVKPSATRKSPTPTKTNPSPTSLPEIVASTPENRDKDRSLFGEIIAENISKYFFLYEKMPNLYSNKSGKLLSSELSDEIYFYNGTENRTNAIGLSTQDSVYVFLSTPQCPSLNPNEIAIITPESRNSIFICMESKEKEEFEVLK